MKKKSLLSYPAIFTKEDDQCWVEFIDLEGCYSDGKTLQDAISNSKEALELYLEDIKEPPNFTRDIKDIHLAPNQNIFFISVSLQTNFR